MRNQGGRKRKRENKERKQCKYKIEKYLKPHKNQMRVSNHLLDIISNKKFIKSFKI